MAPKQSSLRLYTKARLSADAGVVLDKAQVHYIGNVMRRQVSDPVILFNGQDGEWLGELQEVRKNGALVHIKERLRPQTAEPDIHLYFAPLKKIQTALVIQKATELGVSKIFPVQTARTSAEKIRPDKMELQAIEAAEQCERLTLPEIAGLAKLETVLAKKEEGRPLVFCDERAAGIGNLSTLQALSEAGRWSVLVGPEGGFSETEKNMILAYGSAHAISLGPRILRAETAVIASLSLLQAVVGDWQ